METTNKTGDDNSKDTDPGISFQNTPHSKAFKIIVVILTELILLIGAFSLGINVGFKKAFFTYSWNQNYPNNFGGRAILAPPSNAQFFNAHSLDGIILSLDQSNLVIKDEDSNEKTIIITPQTVIRQNFQTLLAKDLKTGEEIVIIGEANAQGQIDAKLIRVLSKE